MSKEDFNEMYDRFKEGDLNPEFIILAGLYSEIRNLKTETQFILRLKDATEILCVKKFFEDDTGMLSVIEERKYIEQSAIETEQPIEKSKYIHWKFPISHIGGIGKFVQVSS